MAQTNVGPVFISYSRRDEAIMRRVVVFLRNQGINVWVDNEKLVPGTPIWEEEIEKAIVSARAVVVLLSPDAKKSPWVRREIGYAEDNGKRIFPVLVAGNERNAIPIRLTNHQRIDIRQVEDTGLKSLNYSLSHYLEEPKLQEWKVSETPNKILQNKVEGVKIEKPIREKAKQNTAKKAVHEDKEVKDNFIFYKSPVWWIVSILVISLSVGGAFLANWGVNSIANALSLELLPSKTFLLVLAGIVWGISYALVGLLEESSPWSSALGIFYSYFLVFDPTDIGDFILGLLSALPINLFLGMALASIAAQTADMFMGWDYDSIYYIVFGVISIIGLGRYIVVLSDI